ncbi:MAG: HD-GYP domain-containing protein, partial [Candidatus Aminicenantales bacterium]
IAEEMNLPSEKIQGLRLAGVIHDIGKIAMPAEILAKPTRLTKTEFQLIKDHPRIGYNILKDIQFPWPVAHIVLQHHERMDGTGYPDGLLGDAILMEARILAVADVVEALSSHRPYRPALGIEKALEEIRRGRGIRYDMRVVDSCMKLFKDHRYSFKKDNAAAIFQ